jgi:hypothetical protein
MMILVVMIGTRKCVIGNTVLSAETIVVTAVRVGVPRKHLVPKRLVF